MKTFNFTSKNESSFNKNVAMTIDQQLKAEGLNVYWSWGIDKKCFAEINGMAGLLIRTNGFCHKGWVYVLLNEGEDLYEVYLQKGKQLKIEKAEKVADGVFCDMLAGLVDELVETGNMTEKEYEKNVAEAYMI